MGTLDGIQIELFCKKDGMLDCFQQSNGCTFAICWHIRSSGRSGYCDTRFQFVFAGNVKDRALSCIKQRIVYAEGKFQLGFASMVFRTARTLERDHCSNNCVKGTSSLS